MLLLLRRKTPPASFGEPFIEATFLTRICVVLPSMLPALLRTQRAWAATLQLVAVSRHSAGRPLSVMVSGLARDEVTANPLVGSNSSRLSGTSHNLTLTSSFCSHVPPSPGSSAETKSAEEVFAEGVKLLESGKRRRVALQKLRTAAEAGIVDAQRVLGQNLLQDSAEEEEQQTSDATKADARTDGVLQELVPTLDARGNPTGGARNASETKLEILRIRNTNRKNVEKVSPAEKRLEALQWLITAAGNGNTDAMVILGNAWFENDSHRTAMQRGLKMTAQDALEFFREAANNDPPHPDALYNLGTMYYDGVPELIEADGKKALELFTKAADVCDDAVAQFWVGQYLMGGDPRVDPDFNGDIERGWDYIARSAEQGHPKAQLYACQFLCEDPEMEDAAKTYLSAAVEQDDDEALFFCGSLCMQEEGSFLGNPTVDYPRALRYFERAAMEGNAEAALSAGAMHYNGLGTPKNDLEAYRAYELAASLGSLDAYRNIASMYYHGEGPLEQSVEIAKEILQAVENIENANSK